eukprot:68644_1
MESRAFHNLDDTKSSEHDLTRSDTRALMMEAAKETLLLWNSELKKCKEFIEESKPWTFCDKKMTEAREFLKIMMDIQTKAKCMKFELERVWTGLYENPNVAYTLKVLKELLHMLGTSTSVLSSTISMNEAISYSGSHNQRRYGSDPTAENINKEKLQKKLKELKGVRAKKQTKRQKRMRKRKYGNDLKKNKLKAKKSKKLDNEENNNEKLLKDSMDYITDLGGTFREMYKTAEEMKYHLGEIQKAETERKQYVEHINTQPSDTWNSKGRLDYVTKIGETTDKMQQHSNKAMNLIDAELEKFKGDPQ